MFFMSINEENMKPARIWPVLLYCLAVSSLAVAWGWNHTHKERQVAAKVRETLEMHIPTEAGFTKLDVEKLTLYVLAKPYKKYYARVWLWSRILVSGIIAIVGLYHLAISREPERRWSLAAISIIIGYWLGVGA